MNAPLNLRLDKASFTAWLDRQDRKYEWKEGRVVQMSNVTKAHARLVSNVLRAFSARLDLDMWAVTASDLGVEDTGWLRFPDVIVEPMDGDDKARRAQQAAVIVEVLSPSSVGIDMTEKPEEYATIATLNAYVVASQDEPILWLWQRDPQTGHFPAKPIEINGREQTLTLTFGSLSIPLAEIYRGIAQN